MISSYKYDFDINLRQWSINTTIKHQGYIRVRGAERLFFESIGFLIITKYQIEEIMLRKRRRRQGGSEGGRTAQRLTD